MSIILPQIISSETDEGRAIQSVTFGDAEKLNNKMQAPFLQTTGFVKMANEGFSAFSTGEKNTWDDWRLLPTIRPVFAPPATKTVYIDVPGGHGALDLSEALSGYPVYNNRVGSFNFRVMNEGSMTWADKYSDIMGYLHGKKRIAILADDPAWTYDGRFEVSAWNSAPTWSEIEISYNVKPFKMSTFYSTDDWLWNPFNFETGIIFQTIFKGIEINSPSVWVPKTFQGVLFGDSPVTPTFIVEDSDMLDMRFVNSYLGIDKAFRLNDGDNVINDVIFFGEEEYTVYFRGVGKIDIKYKIGRL